MIDQQQQADIDDVVERVEDLEAGGGGPVGWDDVTGKPTTLAGFGITDAASDAELTTGLAGKANTSHAHPASDIGAGLIATARLGTGTPSASTFLRGDQTYAVPSGGGASSLW